MTYQWFFEMFFLVKFIQKSSIINALIKVFIYYLTLLSLLKLIIITELCRDKKKKELI